MMIKDIFAKLKAVVSPKNATTAEVHLTNGTIIQGETFKIGVCGAGGGGGSGRAYINRNDLCPNPGGSMAGIVYVAPAPHVAEEVNHEAPNKDTAEPTTIEQLQAENEKLRKLLRPFIYTGNVEICYRVGQNPPPITASEEEAWEHYAGNEAYFVFWRQWRAVEIGRELLGEKGMSETMTSEAKPEIRLEFFCVSDIGRKTRDRLSFSSNRAGIGVFVQNDLEITSVDISLSDARIMAEKLLEYINALGEKE